MSASYGTVRLSPGRDASARDGHPWVFSRALASNQPLPEHGDIVRVTAADGSFLGTASYSARTDIALRFFAMTTYGDGEIDLSVEGLIKRFKELSIDKETRLGVKTDAYRLVHGVGDHFPGLVIDRYANVFVMQISTAAMDKLRSPIVAALREAFAPVAIVERSVLNSRATEGLTPVSGVTFGEVPDPLIITEQDARFYVDPLEGQKTGFFLDQRLARQALTIFAKDRDLLNVFSYTGSFTVMAGLAGAKSSVNIDVSEPALDMLRKNLALNGLEQSAHETLNLDVARALKSLRDQGKTYDLLVVDPPAFVKRRADLGAGTRAYIKTNAHALRLARPGAFMLTCSCSQFVEEDLFRKILVDAAREAHRDIMLLRKLNQGSDHTMRPNFPEGTYLKSWLLRVD